MIPKIVPDRDKLYNWYLAEPFFLDLPDGHRVEIEKGFRFDGHSTRPFHWFFPQNDGNDIVAALLHDYLIATMPWHRFHRKYIDYVYEWAHQEYGHSKCRSFIMPKAVYFKSWLLRKNKYRGEVKPNTVVRVSVL